ncbi:YjbF family lipoprotein [Tropicimonas aquimaris]|uniref:YjbF family lipoprotein n=1 Tax=Tropicimonas aquimaris TaxID=914152 RepID=A0ABW3IWE2_9RHOB
MSFAIRARGGRLALLAALAVATGLAGCGNTPDKAQGWGALYTAFQENQAGREARAKADAGVSPQAIQGALRSVKEPLILAVLEESQRTALLAEFGRNGPYRTFRTSTQQTMTFRDGMLTGTRGLGYDLMSSDATAATAMIRARRSGEVNRVYRHLSGENHEVPTTMRCTIASEGADTVQVASGASFSATRMRETCRADDLTVRNTYWVTGSGDIVQSIQWISPQVGKVALQVLRG